MQEGLLSGEWKGVGDVHDSRRVVDTSDSSILDSSTESSSEEEVILLVDQGRHLSSRILIEHGVRLRSTFWPCTFNLAKVTLGAGMLAIPRAFYLFGTIMGTATLLVVGALTYFTLAGLVSATKVTRARNYGSLVEIVCGRTARVVLQGAVFFNCFGIMVVFLVVVADILLGAAPDYNGILCHFVPSCDVWYLRRDVVLGICTLFVFVPLVALKSMEKLALVNIVGLLSIVAFAIVSVVLAVASVKQGQSYPLVMFPDWDSFGVDSLQILLSLAAIIPVMLTPDICHQSIHPLMPLLKPYSVARMNAVVAAALGICNVLYYVVAVCATITFGPTIHADILKNLDPPVTAALVGPVAAHSMALIVRVGFLLCLVGSYALLIHPLRDVVFELFLCQSRGAARPEQQKGFYVVTYILVVGIFAFAAYCKSIWGILTVMGSTACTIQGFIVPALVMLMVQDGPKVEGAGRLIKKSGAAMVLALGCLLFLSRILLLAY